MKYVLFFAVLLSAAVAIDALAPEPVQAGYTRDWTGNTYVGNQPNSMITERPISDFTRNESAFSSELSPRSQIAPNNQGLRGLSNATYAENHPEARFAHGHGNRVYNPIY